MNMAMSPSAPDLMHPQATGTISHASHFCICDIVMSPDKGLWCQMMPKREKLLHCASVTFRGRSCRFSKVTHVSDTLCEEGATVERSLQADHAAGLVPGADEASSPELASEQVQRTV